MRSCCLLKGLAKYSIWNIKDALVFMRQNEKTMHSKVGEQTIRENNTDFSYWDHIEEGQLLTIDLCDLFLFYVWSLELVL